MRDDVITPEGKLDIPKIRPLARLGYYDYTSVTEVFEMRVPGTHGLLNAGLEGKSSWSKDDSFDLASENILIQTFDFTLMPHK